MFDRELIELTNNPEGGLQIIGVDSLVTVGAVALVHKAAREGRGRR